jgi:hypothetical protein
MSVKALTREEAEAVHKQKREPVSPAPEKVGDVMRHGGVAFVVRSIDDVERSLEPALKRAA